MFIIWGKKRVDRRAGFVADFCPICRKIGFFELTRIGMAGHVYYISVGQGQLVGHSIKCLACETSLSTDARHYAGFAKRKPTDLAELISQTNPEIAKVNKARLDLEETVARSPRLIDANIRAALLNEPFEILNAEVEARFAKGTTFDLHSGVSLTVSILLFILAISFLAGAESGQNAEKIGVILMVIAGAGLVNTLVQFHLGKGRFVRKKIIPKLAMTLEPLSPTQEELDGVLRRYNQMGLRIAKHIKLPDLWAALMQRLIKGQS